ncbi:MAG: cell division protein FtsZ [Legionellales bacterium]|nr:cell division protein FtsZ [Legionellales bacterium]|tara:strand:+ start:662 stop:1873 length:1212 start_codon:yes stop_codon:yes gene_type:complete
MFELSDADAQGAVIKVIGIGGGGCNAVQHMLDEGIEGVECFCANTDAQVLEALSISRTIQLGADMTKGLGAGADPEVGRQAAQEDRDRIYEALKGADMVFLTAGMGGGTGTGAAPVFAEIARELGILTVAVVTTPFTFEGKRRMQVAKAGIEELGRYVDSLITIPNNKLLSVLGKSVSLLSAFRSANAVLQGAVQGIADLITRPGLINVDFADVRTVMSEMGMAMMGTGHASGDDRAALAAEAAVSSPLLEDVDLTGARGILVNLTAGPDMTIGEFEAVGDTIRAFTSENARVVVGTVIDPDLTESIKVTVVVTGLGADQGVGAPESAPRVLQQQDQSELTAPSVHNQSPTYPNSTPARERVTPSFTAQHDIASSLTGGHDNIDYLDIPAFLRRERDEVETER